MENELFLSVSECNSHFPGGGGGAKIENFIECEPE